MPINAALYIGESFAEVGLITDGTLSAFRRFYLARESLGKALGQFLLENNQRPIAKLLFASKSLQATLRRRHGSTAAFIVTAGFENWLNLSRPVRQAHFTVAADRAESLIEPDMIFGLSERISSDGRIEKPIESADLEFLVAKLKLHGVEDVAIGLLHASVNPAHEKLVGHFLRDQGLRVHLSSDISHHDFEVARWWAAVTNAYLGSDWKKLVSEIKAALQSGGHETAQLQMVGSERPQAPEADLAPLASLFGPMLAMSKYRQAHGVQCLFYLGLEDFLMFDGRWPEKKQWRTEFGPVGLIHPGFERCEVQATQLVQKGFLGGPALTRTEGGFEPGPMSFGKSTMPQFLDILWLLDRINGTDGLSERFSDKAKSRVDEALMVMARGRGFHGTPNPHELALNIEREAAVRLAAQVPIETQSLIVAGPLASALRPALDPLFNSLGVKTTWDDSSSFTLSAIAALLEDGQEARGES